MNSDSLILTEKLESASNRFRELFRDCNNREAWIDETTVEYHRLLHLLSNGGRATPEPDSLLGLFLDFVPGLPVVDNQLKPKKTYKEVFGHSMPYVWTVSVDSLNSQIALACRPGGGCGVLPGA
jgi:hypothetical protein